MKLNEGLVRDVKTGIFYRQNTIDKDVIQEVIRRNTYGLLVKDLEPEDTILDLGSHIGTFAILVALKVKRVICFEPSPENFELLKTNTERFSNVELHNKAVTDKEQDKIEFWFITKPKSNNKNTGAGGIYKKRGRSIIMVDNMHIRDVLEQIKPTKIKCDIEGAEYEIFSETEVPSTVKAIIFEIHRQGVKDAKQKYDKLENNLLSQGFTVHKPENFFKNKAWYFTVYFDR